jgi:VIT1/CCC1 family predicted Fe2+/Mn2+ transporter
MRINKGGPQIPVGGADEAGGADKASGAGSKFAEKLDKTAAATGASADKSSGNQRRLSGDIGAALENKEITAEAAVDQVMNRILDNQVGGDTPAKTRAQVENALREALDSDPLLSAKLKTLNGA